MNETNSIDQVMTNLNLCPWNQMEKTFGSPNVKYCEQRICALVNEPVNAWSNFLYILIGIYILFLGYKASKNKYQMTFGAITIFMGLSSFIYHATNNFLAQILDFIGMYFYVYFLIAQCLVILNIFSYKKAKLFYFVAIILSTALIPTAYHFQIHYQGIILFCIVVVLFLQFAIYNKNKNEFPIKSISASFSLMGIAAWFSYADATRIFCITESPWLQGHAIWHILSALAVGFTYIAFQYQRKQYDQKFL